FTRGGGWECRRQKAECRRKSREGRRESGEGRGPSSFCLLHSAFCIRSWPALCCACCHDETDWSAPRDVARGRPRVPPALVRLPSHPGDQHGRGDDRIKRELHGGI